LSCQVRVSPDAYRVVSFARCKELGHFEGLVILRICAVFADWLNRNSVYASFIGFLKIEREGSVDEKTPEIVKSLASFKLISHAIEAIHMLALRALSESLGSWVYMSLIFSKLDLTFSR